MGITETATVENEPQPVLTTCQSIPPPSEPIATLRTTPDTSDTSKGDNERNASHDVSPPATTTIFDPKPSISIPPDPDASPTTSREWHGLPWGFSGQPVPVPVRTRTRTQGSGFETYGSWVWYNPWVSKPVWDRNARNFTCVLKKAI